MDKYHRQIYDGILKHFNLPDLKIIIIASPGAARDAAYDWIYTEAVVCPPYLDQCHMTIFLTSA